MSAFEVLVLARSIRDKSYVERGSSWGAGYSIHSELLFEVQRGFTEVGCDLVMALRIKPCGVAIRRRRVETDVASDFRPDT